MSPQPHHSRHLRPWSWWHLAWLRPSQPFSAHSHAFQLWRALGAEQHVSRLVLATLLAWLQDRPLPVGTSCSGPPPQERTCLRSLAVSLCRHPEAASHYTTSCGHSGRHQRCLGIHNVPGPGQRRRPALPSPALGRGLPRPPSWS